MVPLCRPCRPCAALAAFALAAILAACGTSDPQQPAVDQDAAADSGVDVGLDATGDAPTGPLIGELGPDDCPAALPTVKRIAVNDPVVIEGKTEGGKNDYDGCGGDPGPGADVVYGFDLRVPAGQTMKLTWTVEGAAEDIISAAYEGDCASTDVSRRFACASGKTNGVNAQAVTSDKKRWFFLVDTKTEAPRAFKLTIKLEP